MSDDHELEPGLIESLARIDERLRQGQLSTESIEAELATLAADVDLTDLVDCVKVLEHRWPRTAAAAGAPLRVDALAALHPALGLAISGGQEQPRFGKFLIKSELGRGGFGVVLLAEDTLLSRDVALKLPRPELLLDAGTRQRFLQEAKAAAAIDHPHVAPVFEAGEIGSMCYLAAAYCPGETLAVWLARSEQPPRPRLAARLMEVLALALAHIHEQGILHRDLKPGNVLLWPVHAEADADELPFVPKLTDFGLSKVLAESLVESRSSVLMGTPLYMAPEQVEGRLGEIGPATDVYALGTMLYELLSGQLPFLGGSMGAVFDKIRHAEPPPLRLLNPAVPSELELICRHCLEKRPQDRYPTALALADDLHRFQQGMPITARPRSAGERLLRWCQRPERFGEAGQIVIAVNLALIGNQLMTPAMVVGGLIPAPEAGQPLLALLGPVASSLGAHLPLVYVGREIMRKRLWATIVAFVAGLLMTVASAALVMGWIRNGDAWWDSIPGFRAMYTLMLMLFLMQTLASGVAWIAHRGER